MPLAPPSLRGVSGASRPRRPLPCRLAPLPVGCFALGAVGRRPASPPFASSLAPWLGLSPPGRPRSAPRRVPPGVGRCGVPRRLVGPCAAALGGSPVACACGRPGCRRAAWRRPLACCGLPAALSPPPRFPPPAALRVRGVAWLAGGASAAALAGRCRRSASASPGSWGGVLRFCGAALSRAQGPLGPVAGAPGVLFMGAGCRIAWGVDRILGAVVSSPRWVGHHELDMGGRTSPDRPPSAQAYSPLMPTIKGPFACLIRKSAPSGLLRRAAAVASIGPPGLRSRRGDPPSAIGVARLSGKEARRIAPRDRG